VGIIPTFSHPLWLPLLVTVPFLVWHWLRQGRAAVRFSSGAIVAGLPAGRGERARRIGAILRGLALTSLILALAGPRWPDPGTRVPTYGISIVMIVDVSRSMDDKDFVWKEQPISRLDAVKNVFRLFVAGGTTLDGKRLDGRPNDLIGLVTFGTRVETACPLTLNHEVLLKILDGEEPRLLPGEGTTNLGDGLVWALHRLQKAPTQRKIVVLLTDGEHNVPEPAFKPRQAAQLAANLGIPVYAIHAGATLSTSESAKPASADEANKAKEAMQTIAAMTKGRYFHAADTAALFQVCEQIDAFEKQEILSLKYRRYFEGFMWFALASFVLWLLVHTLESTVWRRSP
jgi:Ca-activated chloride channel family protein